MDVVTYVMKVTIVLVICCGCNGRIAIKSAYNRWFEARMTANNAHVCVILSLNVLVRVDFVVNFVTRVLIKGNFDGNYGRL